MATKTLTKRNIRPAVREETDEEVETKAEAKTVVSKALATLVSGWDKAAKQFDSYFPRIVQYVIENDTSKEEMRQALIDFRGMKPLTANNELSVIFRVAEYPNEVQACIEGDDNPATGEPWRVRDLRDLGKKTQGDGTGRDPEDSFKKRIRNVAKFAIEDAELELADFIAECKAAYKEVHAALEAAAVRAQEKAEGSEEEEGEEEEEI